MTTIWDEDEKLENDVLKIIEDGRELEEEYDMGQAVLCYILDRYARERGIEHERTGEGFKKLFDSLVPSSQTWSERNEEQARFWLFTIYNYKLQFSKVGNGFKFRKVSDEELEVINNVEEYSLEELKKQIAQARYPTLEDKKEAVYQDMERLIDWSDSEEAQNLPVRPELVAEGRKILEGYEKTPDQYKVNRLFIYQSGKKKGLDEAEIEKIIEDHTKVMVQVGLISGKEWTRIKKISSKLVEVQK